MTCGVRLYTASTEAEKVKFSKSTSLRASGSMSIARPRHRRGDRADIVKGFEFEKGRYVTVDPEDLKRLKLASTDCIDITEPSMRLIRSLRRALLPAARGRTASTATRSSTRLKASGKSASGRW